VRFVVLSIPPHDRVLFVGVTEVLAAPTRLLAAHAIAQLVAAHSVRPGDVPPDRTVLSEDCRHHARSVRAENATLHTIIPVYLRATIPRRHPKCGPCLPEGRHHPACHRVKAALPTPRPWGPSQYPFAALLRSPRCRSCHPPDPSQSLAIRAERRDQHTLPGAASPQGVAVRFTGRSGIQMRADTPKTPRHPACHPG